MGPKNRRGGWIWSPHRLLSSSGGYEGNSFKIDHDPEILDLARRQHGHVTRSQLLGMGVSQGLIAGRLKSRAWRRGACRGLLHRSAARGPRSHGRPRRCWRAVPTRCSAMARPRACGGLVSRWSVSAGGHGRGAPRAPRHPPHRCPSLKRRDVSRQLGVPVTSPAAHHPRHRAPPDRQDTDPAGQRRPPRGLSTPRQLQRCPGPQPVPPRHPAPQTRSPRPPRTPPAPRSRTTSSRSSPSTGCRPRCINVKVDGREVDAYFPENDLIVELDGWDYHKDREAFEDDRERDAENLRHGLETLRITKRRMTQTPDREAARLQEILERG